MRSRTDQSSPHRIPRLAVRAALRPASTSAAAGTLAAVLVTAGIVWAAEPDSDGVIHGCQREANGALRIVDPPENCRNGESDLSWNQEGSPGSEGPPGPAGPQGPAGETQAFSARAGRLDLPKDGAFRTVVVQQLPAGKYAAMGGVVLRELEGFSGGTCQLRAGSTVVDEIVVAFQGFNHQFEYSLFGTAALPDGGFLRLMCAIGSGDEVDAMSSRLLAVAVTQVG